MKQEMMGWQWHQLDHMQIVCISLQTDNHDSTSSLNFFTDRMLFLAPNRVKALKANMLYSDIDQKFKSRPASVVGNTQCFIVQGTGS